MGEFRPIWLYNFPPFYTLQPNPATRLKQIDSWCHFVISYCSHFKCFYINPNSFPSSSLSQNNVNQSPAKTPIITLFRNESIGKQLSLEAITLILDELCHRGQFQWITEEKGTNKTRGGTGMGIVFWLSLNEWADRIHTWALSNGFKNGVYTFYELLEAPMVQDNGNQTNSSSSPCFGMPKKFFQLVMKRLESMHKAQIINQDGLEGVKFF